MSPQQARPPYTCSLFMSTHQSFSFFLLTRHHFPLEPDIFFFTSPCLFFFKVPVHVHTLRGSGKERGGSVNSDRGEGGRLGQEVEVGRYRGTSLIRNRPLPRTTIWP